MGKKTLPIDITRKDLHGQAKALRNAVRKGDAEAIGRVRLYIPVHRIQSPKFDLQDCLKVVAKEYGFPSWTALTAYIKDGRAKPV